MLLVNSRDSWGKSPKALLMLVESNHVPAGLLEALVRNVTSRSAEGLPSTVFPKQSLPIQILAFGD